jgi:FkbM family methyltransferase
MKLQKLEKAYVLCANEKYFDIVSMCAKSIREFSKVPIIVYIINSDKKVDVENTNTIKWECDVEEAEKSMYSDDDNFYIKREHVNIYKLLIQRASVTKDALLNHAETIVYIDSDVIVTPYIDRVFEMYDINTPYPYITEGVYDWLQIDGRGGAMSRADLSTTLEHPACDLFGINQYVRERYRTTNIYIVGQKSLPFINEWEEMCNHPKVMGNHTLYAPYHEETLINVLLWKYNYLDGLPYVYVNAGLDKINEVYDKITGEELHISTWFRIPSSRENLLLFHGEKRIDKMEQMIKKISLIEQLKDFNWGWMNNSEEGLFHKQAITFEIFENRLYEQFFEVEENDIVLDIGSSVGPFTYSILPKKPKHVFCIEPSDVEFKTLVSNTIGHPVTQIYKGIASANNLIDTQYLFGNDGTKMEGITFKKLCDLYGLDKIDFIKTDCEGGEYDIFTQDNLQFIKNNVRKIAGEWHLGTQELKDKFRNFRDVYLPQFNNYEVFAIDGVNIKWDLFNEHFIEYYTEVLIYINNKI